MAKAVDLSPPPALAESVLRLELSHWTTEAGASADAIYASHSEQEKNVEEPCVWVMARPKGLGPCCKNPGMANDKLVYFDAESLAGESGGDSKREWVLYEIRRNRGDSDRHFFYKFCLAPKDRKLNKQRWSKLWTVVKCHEEDKDGFFIGGQTGLKELEDRIKLYMNDNGNDNDGRLLHCHIGIICKSLSQANGQSAQPTATSGSSESLSQANGQSSQSTATTGSSESLSPANGQSAQPTATSGSSESLSQANGQSSQSTATTGSSESLSPANGQSAQPTATSGSSASLSQANGQSAQPTATSGSSASLSQANGQSAQPTATSGSSASLSQANGQSAQPLQSDE